MRHPPQDAMPPPSPSPLAFDDTTIDFAGRRLLRGGIEQPLEPKAFGVLALLAGSPGRAFTRDEILDAVWGHRHVTPGVLNRVMTLLRHALGEDAHAPRLLHTVHGVGYRFDLPTDTAGEAAPEAPSSRPAEAEPMPRRRDGDRPWRFARIAAWALPLLAVLALAGWKWWPRTPAAATATRPAVATRVPAMERSIAVLPFANASQDADQQFFSDGLSDGLIDALSKFDGLKVIGRLSSFRFRDGKDDSKAIGAKLGAAWLLSGRVQRSGDVVRIGTTLTRTSDGSTFWAEHYDRPYKDLFALQDEIAQAIATTLHAKLLSAETANRQGGRPLSGNMAAYDAYLRGMQSFHRGDMREVVEYQTEATRIDPAYASAWAYLAVAWTALGENEAPGSAEAKEAFAKAHAAVDTALRLQPDLGAAHGALGNLRYTDAIDWQGALSELRLGARLAPNSGPNQGGFSRILASLGRVQDAIGYRRRFIAIEPLVAGNYFLHSQLLTAVGRLDEAEKDLNIAQELAPRPIPSFQYMHIAILRGNAKAAWEIARAQPSPWREMNVAIAAQIGPDRSTADAALAKAIEGGAWKRTSPYLIAQAYALRGDADRTLAWLERAWAIRDTNIRMMLYDPLILRFRDDPRLIAFCEKIGLPAPNESDALSIDRIRATLADKD
jgi:TolB-like protein/DNA-binding winged helix-turn-helix (wHTH) protein